MAVEASTRDSASTASAAMKNEPPAPPSVSGTSMPMSPSSKQAGIRAGSSMASWSIFATSGRTCSSAKSRTAPWNMVSSSESTVRGAEEVWVVIAGKLPGQRTPA